MLKNYFSVKRLISACTLIVLSGTSLSAQITQTFTYTGAMQSFTVPSCVSSITIEAWGAQGGVGTPTTVNYGGYATGVFTPTAGDVLNIYAGGQPSTTAGGFNGGGSGDGLGFGGGGASDVRLNGNAFTDRIIVAGGAGGGGFWNANNEPIIGGAGGGLVGGDGYRSTTLNPGGSGGGQTALTNGFCGTPGVAASSGSLGLGGNIAVGACGCSSGYGGGGGYYGGGAGGNCRGGGGGSGYILASATNTAFSTGVNAGHGKVVITYVTNGAGVVASASSSLVCVGSSVVLTASNVLSYTWSPGGSSATSITVSPTSSTSYTVEGTNSIGCISSVVLPVIVSGSQPTLAVTSSTPSICLGNSVTISATGAVSYTFSNGISNGVAFAPNATTTYTITGANGCGSTTSNITVSVSVLPVTANASPTLVCSTSPATLTTGGASTYTWLPGPSTATSYVVFPASTTVYTVTGKTGNCLGTNTITVNTNPLPTLTILTPSTTLCSGNSGNLTVSGNAVTYTWNPGGIPGMSIPISPVNSTLYTVTGTNSLGCVKSASQVITVVQNPVLNISVSDPTVCANGSSTLSATGATGSYSWSTNDNTQTIVVNPALTSVYNVTGTNLTGCYSTAMITVEVFEPVISVSSNTSVCLGGNVVIGASGAGSYLWDNGSTAQNINVNPTVSTIYTVTGIVTENISCPASNTVEVAVNALPEITASSSPTAICIGKTASLTADGAGATGTYTWTGGLGNNSSVSVSPILTQNYSVTGTDANGCRKTGSVSVIVSNCVGIENISANPVSLQIYPNPSNDELTVSSEQAITLTIINELGQQIKVITLNSNTPAIKIDNLANGVYFITGKNENGSVREKIIVAK